MSFIYCRTCGWQQDDFWDERYNPFAVLEHDRKVLEGALILPPEQRVAHMDIGYLRDYQTPAVPDGRGGYAVDLREMFAKRFEQLARRVRTMKWWTYQDYKNDPDPRCPVCQGNRFVED